MERWKVNLKEQKKKFFLSLSDEERKVLALKHFGLNSSKFDEDIVWDRYFSDTTLKR